MIKTDNFSNSIYFKVDQVQDKDKTFDAEKTLKQDCIHYRIQNLTQIQSQQQSFMEESEK